MPDETGDGSPRPGLRSRPLVRGLVVAAALVTAAVLVVRGYDVVRGPAPVLRVQPYDVMAAAPPVAAVRPPTVSRSRARISSGPVVSPAWVETTSASTGIPEPAVRAYGTAVLREGRHDAACHLGWTTLAGIGWVESQHGTIGGRLLGADGRPDRSVAGPELDGTGEVVAVPDAAGGWQQAAGPMQFLPSTWDRWASDGDRDGVADAQDVDDAAYAAARYLCASGADLSTGSGWSSAVFSYNHSADYVRAVFDAASTYAGRAS